MVGIRKIISTSEFEYKRGTKIAIMGKSGSGKTTLLKLIAGLIKPDTGNIFFEDKNLERNER